MIKKSTEIRLKEALRKSNYRKSVRTLYFTDIVRTIYECKVSPKGVASTGVGTVVNAYFKKCYDTRKATQVVCHVKKVDDVFEVAIGLASAKCGSRQYPNLAQYNVDVSIHCARKLFTKYLNFVKKTKLVLPAKYKDLVLTEQDSYKVGNCVEYTKKVASFFKKRSIKASSVYRIVRKHFPLQYDRFLRVCEYVAASKQTTI